ncbi:MAG: PilZ domain-containing protein [Desulfobacterales bacterium]
MTRFFEKRSDHRTDFKSPIMVEDSKGLIYKARMVNYNANGLYIETDWLLRPGTEIYIEMDKSPYASQSFDLPERYRAVILWHARLENAFYSYGYGVRYTPEVDTQIPQIEVLQETKISNDLRKYPRKHFSNSIFFTSENGYFEGLIDNISKNGVFIKTQDDFIIGRTVRLVIPGTKIDNGTMLKGEIRHRNRNGIGIQFKQLLKTKSNSEAQGRAKSSLAAVR